MEKCLAWLALFAVLTGCGRSSRPLPVGATIEIYHIAGAASTSTLAATDPETGAPIQLQLPAIVKTADVANLSPCGMEGTSSPTGLEVKLTPAGAAKMAAATSNANGQPIAMCVNGVVVAMPKLMSPIKESFQITGSGEHFNAARNVLLGP